MSETHLARATGRFMREPAYRVQLFARRPDDTTTDHLLHCTCGRHVVVSQAETTKDCECGRTWIEDKATTPPPPPASLAPQEPPLEFLTAEERELYYHARDIPCGHYTRTTLLSLNDARRDLATTRTRVDKLQTFKDYVHKRLDDAGVGKHDDKECRIGGRLDDVLAARAENAGLREAARLLIGSMSWDGVVKKYVVVDGQRLTNFQAALAARRQPEGKT